MKVGSIVIVAPTSARFLAFTAQDWHGKEWVAGEARAGLSVVITNRILNHGGHGEHGGNRGKKYRQYEIDYADSIATRIRSFLPFEFFVFSVNSVVETALFPIQVPAVSFLKDSGTKELQAMVSSS